MTPFPLCPTPLHPTPLTFLLQIGWFHLQVDCREVPTWFAPLQKRYAGFLIPSEAGVKPLQITLFPPHSQTRTTENKVPVFHPDGVIFSPPGWEGQFTYSEQTGWVRPTSSFILEEIDYFLRVVCAVEAFRSGGLLFHAAGILRGIPHPQAYVFFGHSGAGKTTISRLAGKENVLNDDLVLIQPGSSGWTVYSTPFFNPTQITPQGNRHAPLAGLFRLVQDPEVYLENTTAGQALAEVVANVPVISADAHQIFDLLSRCQALLADVPSSRLHFRKDDSFWDVIEKMVG